MNRPKPRVLYGEANFEVFSERNGYYVDKTHFIPLLESFSSPVFLRPRRFGKSLLCTTLEYYYDINHADSFNQLFGRTWIGDNPTSEQGSYFVLHFDFSVVDPSGTLEQIHQRFNSHVNTVLEAFVYINQKRFPEPLHIEMEEDASLNLGHVIKKIRTYGLPAVYLIIDEYDNFANQLIVDRKDHLYQALTHDESFLKSFFKTLKEGRKSRALARIFITGVLPITIDDLASGYNIADFLTLDPDFESMLGFTQTEVDSLLDHIYLDYNLDPATRPQVTQVIKSNYNGYHFLDPSGEALYNSTILMYFLEKLCRFKQIPEFLIDLNLKTDISWVRRLTDSNPDSTRELVDQLSIENQLPYSKMQLRDIQLEK